MAYRTVLQIQESQACVALTFARERSAQILGMWDSAVLIVVVAGALMAADVLLTNVTADTVGREVVLRIIGSQIPPAKMSVQIAITGTAKVQIEGRLHKNAPWAKLGDQHTSSGVLYIEPISALRAVSSETGKDSSVSVWAAWGI